MYFPVYTKKDTMSILKENALRLRINKNIATIRRKYQELKIIY